MMSKSSWIMSGVQGSGLGNWVLGVEDVGWRVEGSRVPATVPATVTAMPLEAATVTVAATVMVTLRVSAEPDLARAVSGESGEG